MPKLITIAEDAYNDLKAGIEKLVTEVENVVTGLDQHHTDIANYKPEAPTPVAQAPTSTSIKAAAVALTATVAATPVVAVPALAPKPERVYSHVHTDEALSGKVPVIPGTPPHAIPQPPAPAAVAASTTAAPAESTAAPATA